VNLELSIAVYQKKEHGELSWTTIGLGPYNVTIDGKGAVKTQRRLCDALRKTVSELDPRELERFQLWRGTRLARVRLELRATGVFPLVVVPRSASPGQRLLCAFHPLRQDDWLFVEREEELADAAQAFFRHAWAELGEVELGALKSDGKDSLKPVSFTAVARTLDAKKKPEEQGRGRQRRELDVLSQIGADQTVRAIEGTLPTGMPRSALRKQLWLFLGGAARRSVIVVGAPKSGKSTAIARWVADLLEADDYPTHHSLDRIHHVWRVSGKRLIAGMSHVGDWEQRCLDLLEQVGKARAILWLEDVHLFGKLGQSRESERAFADLFRGPIARGEVTMVGECTAEQLQRLEDDAPSFAKLFSRVVVPPASQADTLQMLCHVAGELELANGCRVKPLTFRTILEMGAALYPWAAFPGKAVDMLRALAEPRARGESVEPGDVVALLSRQTGLPPSLLGLEAALDVDGLERAFGARVLGQPAAVATAVELICRIRAGLTDPRRPYAVLLFTGPTGTGKTEMAKQIAEFLYGDAARLVRFDMSEYGTADAVPRLIGDRFTPDGLLTQRLREQPFSVLLLDEIEKAHRSVLHLLLQLFEDARLTNAAGDTVSFARAVVIMTSNLGARPSRPVGFGDASRRVLAEIERAVLEFFPLELWNRIDRVVPFSPLTEAVAEAVVEKELALLLGRRGMRERNIFVYAAAAVKARIVREAFDERWGARTVKRFLEDRVATMLAEHISAASSAGMQLIRLYESDGAFRLHVEPLGEVEPHGVASCMEAIGELPLGELALLGARVADALRRAEATLGEVRGRARAATTTLYYLDWYERRARELTRRLGGDRHEPLEALESSWAAARGERQRLRRKREPNLGRKEMADAIAEAAFLARHVATLGEPEAHRAQLELSSVGHADGAGERFIDELLSAYLASLEVVRHALAGRDGAIRFGAGAPAPPRGVALAVLEVAGFAVSRRLADEEGCHIRRSASAEPEIVRVRVLGCELPPSERLARHAALASAFEAALEAGEAPLPENPGRLLPAVRTLGYGMPLRPGEPFTLELLDFREALSETLHVRSLADVLARVWLIQSGRGLALDDAAGAAPADPGGGAA
jgi:ATP-dependent Clp protease ATP-binding subunit ClpA/ATP-dependent Clp protease ATP-binding subunit ClpC